MIWNSWRQRLTYLVMSAFVAWHTLAMVIAPAPESSVLVGTLRAALQPYLTLFKLDNPWNFFAPVIGGTELHYSVEDAAGAHHNFTPTPRDAHPLRPRQVCSPRPGLVAGLVSR